MSYSQLENQLSAFRKRFYQNTLLRGGLIFLTVALVSVLITLGLEYYFYFGTTGRTVLFFCCSLLLLSAFVPLLLLPLLKLVRLSPSLTADQSAVLIGNYFPQIGDKLLNVLQLNKLNSSELAQASISQRIESLQYYKFYEAIDLRINRKYLNAVIPVILVMVLIAFWTPNFYKDSTSRIVNFNKEYARAAPFTFSILNEKLTVYKNENYTLQINLDGEFVPSVAEISINDRKVRMSSVSTGSFSHEFTNVQSDIEFLFFAAGYESQKFVLHVINRPELLDLGVALEFPRHMNIPDRTVSGTGNISVPEGTKVSWDLSANYTDSAVILFDKDESKLMQTSGNQTYRASKVVSNSQNYQINLWKGGETNIEKLSYEIEVTKDEFPSIDAEFFADTILYEFIIISGIAKDDYGFSSLSIVKSVKDAFNAVALPITSSQKQQSYYYKLDLDSLDLTPGSQLEISAQVRDSDTYNGFKLTKSNVFVFQMPDRNTLEQSLIAKSNDTENLLDKSIKQTELLNEQLKTMEERLKSKNDLEWQEEKMLNDILKQREDIEKSLNDLQSKFDQLQQGENKFNERDQELKNKADQLQSLMDELLDDETRELYKELEKLLQEKGDLNSMKDQLNKISSNEKNMEKEIERALELFKRLKLESEIDKTAKGFEELSEEQQKLADESNSGEKLMDEMKSDQKQVDQKYEELRQKLSEINEMNQELKNPEPIQSTTEEQEKIAETLEDIQESQENNDRKQSGKQQKESAQQMKQMSNKLQQMQASMEMEMMQENMEHLRYILDDLIRLSFKQEDLITDFKTVRQSDPRFVELSQDQLKLGDDAQIIEDSLISLAKRVVQLSSFVTREVGEVNTHMDAAILELKNRDRSKALSHQQFAMTSMNNLALLLESVLNQMQMAMGEMSGKPKKGEKSGNQPLPNLKQLQKELSQKIEQLQKSGMEGRQLSEELAKMAAEQEMLRNELQKIQDQMKGQPGNEGSVESLGQALEEMEKNEIDLVNKRITKQLIDRQKLIETRMLEAENSMREQEMDKDRKGETANQRDNRLPPAYEEYLKAREKELELLKTVPLDLNPFYKKEVNDYFRRLSNQD